MSEPLRFVFEADCDAGQAFALWTERAWLWWPRSHTSAPGSGARIVFQPGVGGRIFERLPEGTETDWGSVLVWQPPTRLVYAWHIFSDSADATEVEVRFTDNGNGTTRVEIEHRGWEAFTDADQRRARNQAGWEGLVRHYRAACAGQPSARRR